MRAAAQEQIQDFSWKLRAETSQNSKKQLSKKVPSLETCLHWIGNASRPQVRLVCLFLSSSFR